MIRFYSAVLLGPDVIKTPIHPNYGYFTLSFKIRKKRESNLEDSIPDICMPQAGLECEIGFSQRHHTFQRRTGNFSCCQGNCRILAPQLTARGSLRALLSALPHCQSKCKGLGRELTTRISPESY